MSRRRGLASPRLPRFAAATAGALCLVLAATAASAAPAAETLAESPTSAAAEGLATPPTSGGEVTDVEEFKASSSADLPAPPEPAEPDGSTASSEGNLEPSGVVENVLPPTTEAEQAPAPETPPAPAEESVTVEEVGPSAASPQVAELEAPGYYRAPWSSVIHEVTPQGGIRQLNFAEWDTLGRPSPQLTPVTYVKVPWSTTVYALIVWPRSQEDTEVRQVAVLGWPEYVAAGRPRVQTVAHVKGTRYVTLDSSKREIHARTPDGARTRLTYAQWRAASEPTPQVEHGGYYRAPWSKDIHEVSAGGKVTRLTYAAWVARGEPTPALTPVRYVKTPWNPDVYALLTWPSSPSDRTVGQVAALGWKEYAAAGQPRVESVGRIPGDRWVRYTAADTVFHEVRGVLTPVTYAQWSWAGRPIPAVRTAPSPTYIRGVLLVNKSFPLPQNYGSGLTRETSTAFESMRSAAAREGLSLFIRSGFRSYATQRSLYASYVAKSGQAAADRYSARAGHSEHQSGLALDVNSTSGSFASTREGRWVKDNAHRFGFIVRYPQGKEHITGYMYEPWHLRYVGNDLARTLYSSGQTLEEYLMVPSRY